MKTTPLSFVPTVPLTLRVDQIHANPLNPRKPVGDARKRLVEEMRAGQLVPVWVRKHAALTGQYELVDGECRWWGAKLGGLEMLRAELGDWTDEQVVLIALKTGTSQERLNPIAEARGVAWLLEMPGATQQSVADKVNFSQAHVRRLAQVLEGRPEVIAAVEAGKLPITTACLIVEKVADPVQQVSCLRDVVEPKDEVGPLSGDQAKRLIALRYSKPARVPVAGAGEVALSVMENAAVFPDAATEPEPDSGYVCHTRPIPADLLKPEVQAAALKFADITEGVQVYVGVDGAGQPVRIVKLEEAFAAVTEPTIFKEEAVQRYGLSGDAYIIKAAKRGDRPEQIARHLARSLPDGAALPVARVEEVIARNKAGVTTLANNQREVEASQKKELKKAARAQKKKDEAAVAWLGELKAAIVADKVWLGLTYWSLKFEEALGCLKADEMSLLLGMEDADMGDDPHAYGLDLEKHAGGLALPQLIGLVEVMMKLPVVRELGLECALVKEWHATIIAAPKPTAPAVVAFAGLPEAERKKLTGLVAAHVGGMSVPKLAREFGMGLRDVCGALELDYESEAAEWSGLGEALEVAFAAGNVGAPARVAMIKLQLGREVAMAELVPEEINKLLEMMGRVAALKGEGGKRAEDFGDAA